MKRDYDKLLKHAGITEKALFVGKGRTFQIWNPETYQAKEADMRKNALEKHFNIKNGEA